jgi:Flp pilus assembly pilin Flp
MKRFLQDEEGQATAEYILMLSIVAILTLAMLRKWIKPMLDRAESAVARNLEKKLFGGDLHSLRFGR